MSSQYILIAKIGKSHGLKGECLIHFFGDNPQQLTQFSTLFQKENEQFIPLRDITFQIRGKQIIAQFKGIDNRQMAQTLTGKEIYILRQELPPLNEGEYYHIDLIGCQGYFENRLIGIVKNVANYGTGDLFEMENNSDSTFYIPFEYIKEMQLSDKVIYFKDLEGFI